MFEYLINTSLESIVKIETIFILFIVGGSIVDIRGGYPFIDGLFVSRIDTLVGLAISGLLILFVIDPLIENILFSYLTTNTSHAIPSLLVLAGVAILVFDQKMAWNFRNHGLVVLLAGICWWLIFP